MSPQLLLAPKLLLLPPVLLLLPPGLTSQMATLGLTQLMTTLGLTQQMATLLPTKGVLPTQGVLPTMGGGALPSWTHLTTGALRRPDNEWALGPLGARAMSARSKTQNVIFW